MDTLDLIYREVQEVRAGQIRMDDKIDKRLAAIDVRIDENEKDISKIKTVYATMTVIFGVVATALGLSK